MASGDVTYQVDEMCIATDYVGPGRGTTRLQHSNGDAVVVEHSVSGVQETVFDTSKTYDVIIKEH